MRGTSKNKVVSSGRLTGAGRGHSVRRRITSGHAQKPLPRPCAEPDYSLYSTDSEDQVTTLHKGLDRCAALLNDFLQADVAGPKPNQARAAKGTVTKPRAHSSQGKEAVKKKAAMKPISKTAPVHRTTLPSHTRQRLTASTQPGPSEAGPSLPVTRQHRPAAPTQSGERHPGVTANGQSGPCGSSFGAQPQTGNDYEGVARFNCRLTTSTPTLGPEEPPFTPAGSAPPGEHRAPSAAVGGMPKKRPLPRSTSLGCSLPGAGRASRGVLGHSYPPLGARQADRLPRPTSPPGSLSPAPPGAPCPCSVHLCELHAEGGGGSSAGTTRPEEEDEEEEEPVRDTGRQSSHDQPAHAGVTSAGPGHQLESWRSEATPPNTCANVANRVNTANANNAQALHTQQKYSANMANVANVANMANVANEDNEDNAAHVANVANMANEDNEDNAAHVANVANMANMANEDNEDNAAHVANVANMANEDNAANEGNAQTRRAQQASSALGAALDDCTTETTERRVKTLQYLLGELKALLACGDGTAERALRDLGQTAAPLPATVGGCNVQAEIALALQSLRSQNAQLRRRVRILNLQLQERERAERERRGTDGDSEALTLQVELSDAQSQLQELRGAVAELRQALQDTQGLLQQSEAETSHLKTELEDTTSRLLESQSQRGELALLAQQRLEEIHTLQHVNRILQGGVSVVSPGRIESLMAPPPPLTRQVLDQYQSRRDPSDPAPDPIGQYLKSLTPSRHVPASPPCKGPASFADTRAKVAVIDSHCEDRMPNQVEQNNFAFAPLRETGTSPHRPVLTSQHGGRSPAASANSQSLANVFQLLNQSKCLISAPHLDQSGGGPASQPAARRQLDMRRGLSLDSTLFPSEEGSALSDWSVASGSSFNTRDEVEFQNGLAALDASIASLQRTIKMDLAR